ncbi:MAG: outer membrane beta-barrel protein [Granulosicoccus sp.]
MRKLLSSLALSLGMMVGTAHADVAKMYFGAGLSDGSVEIPGSGDKSLGTANVTLGFQLLDFVGIELEVGVASDQPGSMLSEPLVQYQAAMIRLGYRWDRAGVYVLGGQARIDMDSSLGNSDAGTAVGFGINLFGNETTALNLHVLRLDDGAFTSATVGFQYYFGGFR